MNELNIWSLAGELGFIIVIPLIIFLFIGLKLDQILNTKPMFILGSLGIALVISCYMVARKIRHLNTLA